MKGRDHSIETLRAIAVALVVAFHFRGDPELGSALRFYEWLAYTFGNVRIPLFTVISGYLYAARPVKSTDYGAFVLGKTKRLLVPMWTVATLEHLARAFVPGVSTPVPLAQMWRIYVMPYDVFWFLQALFLALLLVAAMDVRRLLERLDQWLLAALVAFLLMLVEPVGSQELLFSLGGFFNLLPFFLLGVGISRFPAVLMGKRVEAIAAALFFVTLLIHQANWQFDLSLVDGSKAGIVGILMGLSLILLLFRWRPRHPLLAWIGGFSFTIYLFQAFGAGIGRRLLDIPGINPHLYFVGLLVFTIAFGVVLELVVNRIPVLRGFLLGKWRRRAPTIESRSAPGSSS